MRIVGMKPVITREQIDRRLDELASEINAFYAGKPLVVICVLKGGFMFFADLIKRLSCNPEIDFVRLASYGSGDVGRNVTFTKDVELPLKGKHVLIVEDIVDTGHTMDFLLKQMTVRGALSLRLAVLLDKAERREVPVRADFVGFPFVQGFLVGYGLDYAEQFRELPAVYELIGE